MKWFMKSSNDAPRLISLSPLRHSDQQDGRYHIYDNVNTPSPSPRRSTSDTGEFFPTKDLNESVSTISRKSRIDSSKINFAKKQSHSSPKCYNIQEGKIIENHRPVNKPEHRRFISPIRIKNKSLGTSASPTPSNHSSNSSTPVRRKITQQLNRLDSTIKSNNREYLASRTLNSPARSERPPIPTWEIRTGTTNISNEKRNPLADTRLSCYKPKISDKYSLPAYYKSVDDFLILNSGEDADSTISTTSSEEIKRNSAADEGTEDNKMNGIDICADVQNVQMKRDSYEYDKRGYGVAKLTTKSVENILEPKLYELAATPPGKKAKKPNMLHISDKIKTMSSRTQKLFSRIYNSGQPKQSLANNGSETNERRLPFGMKAATCRIKTPKSRRSLSFGNLPGLDDFKQVLKEIDHLDDGDSVQLSVDKPAEASTNSTLHNVAGQQRLHDEVKDDLLDECEDTDSGILVNESGQSSIIETDEIFLSDGNGLRPNGGQKIELNEAMMSAQDVNANIEFKFVRLRIDTSCGLGIGIKSIASDLPVNRRVGYQVATIAEGGMVHSEGTIQVGDEIVNISGRSVRGISMNQVRELLESSYNNKAQTDIDMVICRYGVPNVQKVRKKSIDSYLTDLNDNSGIKGEFNEFASTALRIDGGKFNTIGTRRSKPPLSFVNSNEQNDGNLTSNMPSSPHKKRAPQFLKNHTSYCSMSNKLFRRSLIGKQAGQQQKLFNDEQNQDFDGTTPQSVLLPSTDMAYDDQTAPVINDSMHPSLTALTPPYKQLLAQSSFNLCDDEKLTLSLMHNGDMTAGTTDRSNRSNHQPKLHESSAGNYCTLPRRPKSALCSFHTIVYEKGPGKKKLGFTVVGGTDTGAVGIFIKSILPTGQAGQDGRLKAGDEILAVNGQVCHDLSHEEAVKLFKSVKCGEIALQVCRRSKPAKLNAT